MKAYQSFALVYDRLMSEMPYDRWEAFLRQTIERFLKTDAPVERPLRLVDLGCGTGNVAIPLAAGGYNVVGIDFSAEMLAVAEQKWSAVRSQSGAVRQGSLRLLECDMCEWELTEPVDVVYSFCDSVNYVTDEADLRQLLRTVAHRLLPGGLFVFDVHPEATFEGYHEQQPFIWNEDDLAYIWTCEYERPLIHHELTIFVAEAGGTESARSFQRIDEWHVQRAYPLEQLRAWLLEAGFNEVHGFAEFSFAEASEAGGRSFFVARK